MRCLVAAIGNPDRGDDGAGALVAVSLAGRLPPGVALVVHTGDPLALLDDWAGCDTVICADAAAPMGTPGRIHRIDVRAGGLPPGLSFPSSHAFGLAQVIALAQTLGTLPPKVIVYAIEAEGFGYGAAVSPEVAASAETVAGLILAEFAL